MPLTYQILSWHVIYEGKTKQTNKRISVTPKQNHQLILYSILQKTDIKICDNARQPAGLLEVLSAAMRNNTRSGSSTLFQKKLPASLQDAG